MCKEQRKKLKENRKKVEKWIKERHKKSASEISSIGREIFSILFYNLSAGSETNRILTEILISELESVKWDQNL